MIRKGLKQSDKFSWGKTAELTLQVYNKVTRGENEKVKEIERRGYD